MKKVRKIVALSVAAVMAVGTTACGGQAPAEQQPVNQPAEQVPAETGAADAQTPSAEPDTAAASTENDGSYESCTLSFSWWGGESRHTATLDAVKAFEEKYPGIKVESTYGAWSGWEDSMATMFATSTAPDVNQINWNWLDSYSADGSAFLDLNQVSDVLDLSQYSQEALGQCTVAGELQAVPVSMTGRIFYWNKSTFDKAGIDVPKTLEELKAAGETFRSQLGDDYYPIALGEYDRMILMVYYLESVYGKPWVADDALQYTAEEIQEGLAFIQSLEDAHVTPSIQTITGDGAESHIGRHQGGYSKVSLAFAISESCAHPKEAAMLLNFLLNEDEGTTIMASERGIPLSAAALANCEAKDLLNATVAEANGKVLDWVTFPLDFKFEAATLKNSDGVYYDVMAGLSYGDYDMAEAASILIDGIEEELNK